MGRESFFETAANARANKLCWDLRDWRWSVVHNDAFGGDTPGGCFTPLAFRRPRVGSLVCLPPPSPFFIFQARGFREFRPGLFSSTLTSMRAGPPRPPLFMQRLALFPYSWTLFSCFDTGLALLVSRYTLLVPYLPNLFFPPSSWGPRSCWSCWLFDPSLEWRTGILPRPAAARTTMLPAPSVPSPSPPRGIVRRGVLLPFWRVRRRGSHGGVWCGALRCILTTSYESKYEVMIPKHPPYIFQVLHLSTSYSYIQATIHYIHIKIDKPKRKKKKEYYIAPPPPIPCLRTHTHSDTTVNLAFSFLLHRRTSSLTSILTHTHALSHSSSPIMPTSITSPLPTII